MSIRHWWILNSDEALFICCGTETDCLKAFSFSHEQAIIFSFHPFLAKCIVYLKVNLFVLFDFGKVCGIDYVLCMNLFWYFNFDLF